MRTATDVLHELTGHPVPEALLRLLENYPPDLATLTKDAGFAPYETFVFPDLDTLLAGNVEVRAEDIWTEEGPWPAEHLVIGADIGGDRFTLHLGETPPRVHRLNHETGRLEPLAAQLEDFVAACERLGRREARTLRQALATKAP